MEKDKSPILEKIKTKNVKNGKSSINDNKKSGIEKI